MFERVDTVMTNKNREKPSTLICSYNPQPVYEANPISIREEVLKGHESRPSRPRANTLHQTASSEKNSKHKIRVGRGRLPEDFFTKVDLLRINTVQSSLKRKCDYGSLQTPTFASRAHKATEQSRLFADPSSLELEKFGSNEQSTVQQPFTKKTANFFNGGQDKSLLAKDNWQSKAIERKLRDKLELQQVQSSRLGGREPPNSRNLLMEAQASKHGDDSYLTTANTTLVMRQPKHQSAGNQRPKRNKQRDSKHAIGRLENGPLTFDTMLIRNDIKDFAYKRKFKESALLREDLFDVPSLRFPHSDRNQQAVLHSLRSSILPSLK